jgi:SAM-dependent methyltransferase
MSAVRKLFDQCREPKGAFGRFWLWNMNLRHSPLTDWGLAHLAVDKHHTVLDIGCGGGRTIRKLSAMASEGKVYGIDHSEASVLSASRTNAKAMQQGRVEIQKGSVSHLPFPNDTFDAVTAVETHYFWPDLNADMREVLRVLKPGGKFIVIAEAYRGGKHDHLLEKLGGFTGMKVLSATEHNELMRNAGYSDVQVFEKYEKGWLCSVGGKSAVTAGSK